MSRPQNRWLQALGLGALLFVAGGLPALGQQSQAPAVEQEAPAAVQQTPGSASPGPSAGQGSNRQQRWAELIERDERISFTLRTENDARSTLLEPELTEEERCTALMALGCARPEALREKPVLDFFAVEATEEEASTPERMAAILALGELGVGVEGSLVKLLDDQDSKLRACAMQALLRTDRTSARARVSAIADGSGGDATMARALLVGSIDAQVSRPTWVGELRFGLRWRAAQRYGLVDGISWKLRNLQILLTKPQFLDGVVLRAAATSTERGVKDFLLRQLLEHDSVASLRAVTRAMPEELAALIANDLYVPQGALTWQIIMAEIDEAGIEDDSLALLELSLDVPEVATEALMLLARAGVRDVLTGLEEEWDDLTPRDRLKVLEAWGKNEKSELLIYLKDFKDDPNPRVRAGVRLARARLGDPEAVAALEEILSDQTHPDFNVTLGVALRLLDAKLIKTKLAAMMGELEGEPLIKVATELALHGDLAARELLAQELRLALPRGRVGARAVRALSGNGAGLYADLFVKHFPVEDDVQVNVELALALLDAKANRALLYLRPALWSDPFDRSVLAGLLMIQVVGIHGLRDEYNRPPVEANSRDFRRLGYMLGVWGGLEEVEWLMERSGLRPGDPVLQGAVLGALGRRTY